MDRRQAFRSATCFKFGFYISNSYILYIEFQIHTLHGTYVAKMRCVEVALYCIVLYMYCIVGES
jgi:hypothetical protein